jgi:hypothetical protein
LLPAYLGEILKQYAADSRLAHQPAHTYGAHVAGKPSERFRERDAMRCPLRRARGVSARRLNPPRGVHAGVRLDAFVDNLRRSRMSLIRLFFEVHTGVCHGWRTLSVLTARWRGPRL